MEPVQFLTSNLLTRAGVRHGWFMRFGGVSVGLHESLNGKKGNGDTDGNVDENRTRACQALGLNPENLIHIIHEFKTNILEADKTGEHQGFDASIAASKGQVLSQTTADCGTVIITNASGSVVSVVHGSWHTLKEEIICDVVAKIKAHTNEELVAGIGPMICKNCFEFGPEATTLFDHKYLTCAVCHPPIKPGAGSELVEGSSLVSTKNPSASLHSAQDDASGKYLVDLKQMIIDQLADSGVAKIDDVNVCTLEDKRFFSHRRSGAHSGRLITLAGL